MSLLARIFMVASWLILAIGMLVIWVDTLAGDASELWYVLDLPDDFPQPPVWACLIGIVMTLIVLAALWVVYLSIHRILKQGADGNFGALAMHLKKCAIGLICFWAGLTAVGYLLPVLLTWQMSTEIKDELDLLPLDLDVIFLVLGIALLAISGAMRRADDVEAENQQFV